MPRAPKNERIAELLGQMLTEIRQEHDVTQRGVAEHMGTQQSAIADLEAGKTFPQVDTLIRYLVAVGMAWRPPARSKQ